MKELTIGEEKKEISRFLRIQKKVDIQLIKNETVKLRIKKLELLKQYQSQWKKIKQFKNMSKLMNLSMLLKYLQKIV